MKKLFLPFVVAVLFSGCEDVIDPGLPEADDPIVVDAWLYRKAEPQTISITRANAYFDQNTPQGISGATVNVYDADDLSSPLPFLEEEPGKYVWNPINPSDSFGSVGQTYVLDIELNGDHFNSVSSMNRVPKVDSITWRLEPENAFFDDAYFGEFWARDFAGEGDVYWIKTWKNGEFLSKPHEIFIAYDAGFSEDGNADGLTFIQPIRDAMNPFDQDEDNNFLPPYKDPLCENGLSTLPREELDSAYVEINSITYEAYFFLFQVQLQTNRPGGFGELFSTPLANSNSNIFSDDSDQKIVGFFCTSAVSGLGRKFDCDAVFED